MTYQKYKNIVIKRFPELNIDKIPNLNKIECLKMVSTLLFTINECETELANITRKKIQEYWKNGYIKDF